MGIWLSSEFGEGEGSEGSMGGLNPDALLPA